MTVKLN